MKRSYIDQSAAPSSVGDSNIPHRHAAAAREAGGKRIAHRRTGSHGERARSSRRSIGCTGASGTARPKMPRKPSIASARSCIRGHRTRSVASRKLWHSPHEIDQCVRSQSARLVNYAARHRAGMRVGTAVTEDTANFLVNRPMNKPQQMRWSRRDAPTWYSKSSAQFTTERLVSASADGSNHWPSRCGCRNRRVTPPVSGHSLLRAGIAGPKTHAAFPVWADGTTKKIRFL